MVLFGYCYFILFALDSAAGGVIPVPSGPKYLPCMIAAQWLPGITLSCYALTTGASSVSLVWIFFVLYHTGSLGIALMLIGLASWSRVKDKVAERQRGTIEPRRTTRGRRAYGTAVYAIHILFWYLSFGA